MLRNWMRGWYDDLVTNTRAGNLKTHNNEMWDPKTSPTTAQGAGCMVAPRGALGHWIVIENRKIASYQAVVPTTWNAGPRDATGAAGPCAAAPKGHSLAVPEHPLEILRSIHSFDPCIASGAHGRRGRRRDDADQSQLIARPGTRQHREASGMAWPIPVSARSG